MTGCPWWLMPSFVENISNPSIQNTYLNGVYSRLNTWKSSQISFCPEVPSVSLEPNTSSRIISRELRFVSPCSPFQ